MPDLDPIVCRQAHVARDPRFDGQFFLGVMTTGIYCRPICPARTAAARNVRYFASAAAAAADGFRPCLRCRPESAPLSPAWRGTQTTLGRALQLISEGALNEGSVEKLAARLGVGERYLRKLFERELGVSPGAVARTQRLHFARKLLTETSLPISQVAFASGFGSLRSFNANVRRDFDCAPRQLRGSSKSRHSDPLVLALNYRPPYDWNSVLNFFARHAIAGVETVDDSSYSRVYRSGGHVCRLKVEHDPRRNALMLYPGNLPVSDLLALVSRVRRMFDLDASPLDISAALNRDRRLRQLLKQWPGIRAPGHWSQFESALRAVVGQQISLGAARGVLARIVAAALPDQQSGQQPLPGPEQILALADEELPMPQRRKATLRAVCRYFAERNPASNQDPREPLAAITGVGPWTLDMLGLRGLSDPDRFPVGDLMLRRSYSNEPELSPRELATRMERCKPWRSYAANLLWRNAS